MRQYRVFFSNDCLMYGVQAWRTDYGYRGEPGRWVQVLPPQGKGARGGKSAYTYYEGVAKRWLRELTANNN